MTGKYDPIFTCVVCGAHFPGLSRMELRSLGCSISREDGSEIFHCLHHSQEEIQKMILAAPTFSTGNKYKEFIKN